MKKTMILVLLALSLSAFAKEDTATVNKLILESKGLIGSDPDSAKRIATRARDLAHKLNFDKGEALAIKNIGIVFFYQQNYNEALNYWEQSLALFEKAKDQEGIANILNNIAGAYMKKGIDDKALDYAFRSLAIAEKLKNDVRILSALGNIGSIYHNKKDPRALEYLFRALSITQKEGKPILLANIGEFYFDLAESIEHKKDSAAVVSAYLQKAFSYYDSSIVADPQGPNAQYAFNGKGKVFLKQGNFGESIANHLKALSIAEKVEDKINIFRAYYGLGNAYFQTKQPDKAIANYRKAQDNAEEIEGNDIAELYRDMSKAYRQIGDMNNAYEYLSLYAAKQDEIFDIEEQIRGEKITRNDFEQKQTQLALITKQKQIEQQAKYGFAGGLFAILVIVVILFRNYKDKVRTNKLLDKQKDQIEALLLNILPAEVAKELQHTGKATPTHYEDVSVLFSDFKGFTTIADKMSPSELVSQLNTCFMAFDNIVEKYGLEKIKTIGDAYMCAGGIPMPNKVHSLNIVKAAREIQEWIKSNNEQRALKGQEPWDIRIGIHNGPLVAGVVGKKKYAYDIWGSTVNIASRMESNGEPGRVNLSAAAYEKIKDKYNCTYRGKIHAKNVGEIDMYFLGDEINETAEVAEHVELSAN